GAGPEKNGTRVAGLLTPRPISVAPQAPLPNTTAASWSNDCSLSLTSTPIFFHCAAMYSAVEDVVGSSLAKISDTDSAWPSLCRMPPAPGAQPSCCSIDLAC